MIGFTDFFGLQVTLLITEPHRAGGGGGHRGQGGHGARAGPRPLTALTAPVRLEGDFIRFRGD